MERRPTSRKNVRRLPAYLSAGAVVAISVIYAISLFPPVVDSCGGIDPACEDSIHVHVPMMARSITIAVGLLFALAFLWWSRRQAGRSSEPH